MLPEVFNNQFILTIQELKSSGLSYYKIQQLQQQGVLKRLNKTRFENLTYQGDKIDQLDFYYASAFIPKGVICLLSAAAYYGFSTYRPPSVDVAVARNANVTTLPDWPQLHLWYFQAKRLYAGIQTITDNGDSFFIYNPEKTVADIVYYRERIGIEETREVLRSYLTSQDIHLNQLLHYADELRCGAVMRKYLEVLV